VDAKEFGAWRRRVRLTQEGVAGRLGVSRTTVQNWESGASPISGVVEMSCRVWEHRLRQEDPRLGPVTLVYADGPMFVDPYRPRRIAMMRQEPYPTNSAALGRVLELWGRDDFHNPFILDETGDAVWNSTELLRVVGGQDDGAPTPDRWRARSIAALAEHLRETSHVSVRSGPRMLSPQEVTEVQGSIEELAGELARMAPDPGTTYRMVEAVLDKLRRLGKHAPTELVSEVAQALHLAARPSP
jgi:hypothetical protein